MDHTFGLRFIFKTVALKMLMLKVLLNRKMNYLFVVHKSNAPLMDEIFQLVNLKLKTFSFLDSMCNV